MTSELATKNYEESKRISSNWGATYTRDTAELADWQVNYCRINFSVPSLFCAVTATFQKVESSFDTQSPSPLGQPSKGNKKLDPKISFTIFRNKRKISFQEVGHF